MEQLLALQKLQLETTMHSLNTEREILRLRKEVPAPVLGRVDRFLARGKKGVAIACNGVCSECHLGISSGICDNCGRYLYLPEDEPLDFTNSPLPPKTPVKSPARRTPKKPAVYVA